MAIVHNDEDNEDWSWIWKLICGEKVKMFTWLLAKGKLLTNAEREKRHLTNDALCAYCGAEAETLRHLFWDCQAARNVWRLTLSPVGFQFAHHVTIWDWLKQNCCSKVMVHNEVAWSSIFCFTLWGIWKARNTRLFNNTDIEPRKTVQVALAHAMESRIRIRHVGIGKALSNWIKWSPPEENWLKLNTDGAFERHNGMASAGGSLETQMVVGFGGLKSRLGEWVVSWLSCGA